MIELVYEREKTKEISFPLGGIGTGSIGFSGNGALIDWEIFNKPNKGGINHFSHFAIKAEKKGKILSTKVLNGDFLNEFTGEKNKDWAWGFGIERTMMPGFPHFRKVKFIGNFPIAKLILEDDEFPGKVTIEAFNPFIPSNENDSSIPCAMFDIRVENTQDEEITYTLVLSCRNPNGAGETKNEYYENDETKQIYMTSNKITTEEINYIDLTISTKGEEVSYQEYWYRGGFYDSGDVYWQDLNKAGDFKNRRYDENNGYLDVGLLANKLHIEPYKEKKAKFVITWNTPNCENYWNPRRDEQGKSIERTWKNYYTTLFENSRHSGIYCIQNWERLYEQTRKFTDILYNSTMPKEVVEAIGTNLATIKSTTCLRLEDGTFYGFEGVFHNTGVCEGSCTHVWNYAYALPFLFPNLERSLRNSDYKYNFRPDGSMAFRMMLPLGRDAYDFRPCVDGQFGGIIKVYREFKISGDLEWLKSLWPKVKESLEFAWSEKNIDRWDFNKDGVLEGRQHHTLDVELFGPSSWLNGFYLAALKAAVEIAKIVGDTTKAEEYENIFLKGKTWVDEQLFNGEYYTQQVDLKNKQILEDCYCLSDKKDESIWGYWSDEHKEMKYQIKEGCEIDQVVAQWHANLCGLGEIFDHDKVLKSLQSIYKYNFIKNMRNYVNNCRVFSLNDERGVIICSWPSHVYRQTLPLTYATETMTGFEYQVACHMISEGMISEGVEIVKVIRERFDGEKRDPFNEYECGSHYARSLASYSLLLAYSGFKYDLSKGMIGFNPIMENNHFYSFWSVEGTWGSFAIDKNTTTIKFEYGKLKLNELLLPYLEDGNVIISFNDKILEKSIEDGIVVLDNLKLAENDVIIVKQ